MSEKPRYWFKRRRYGYGWTPVTTEGWITVLVFLVFIACTSVILLPSADKPFSSLQLVIFLMFLVSAIFIMVGISYAKGPMPRWRWGKKPDDNPDEDI